MTSPSSRRFGAAARDRLIRRQLVGLLREHRRLFRELGCRVIGRTILGPRSRRAKGARMRAHACTRIVGGRLRRARGKRYLGLVLSRGRTPVTGSPVRIIVYERYGHAWSASRQTGQPAMTGGPGPDRGLRSVPHVRR